jgi:hypothetical protein
MAIQSNFSYKGTDYDAVVFKIVRVFGSKAEGWNAVFAFVTEGDEFIETNFKGLMTIGLSWEDKNPFPLLYKRMEEILTDGGFTIVREASVMINQPSFIETAWIEELIPAEEVKPKPKKTRITKVKKADGVSSDS